MEPATIGYCNICGQGRLATTTHENDSADAGDDVIWDYDYDLLNRLDLLEVTNGTGNRLLWQDFDYESDGQKDQVLEKRYDGASATPFSTARIDWGYDALGRLTEEVRDEGDDGVFNVAGLDYRHVYSFDLSGNRIEKQVDADNDGAAETTTDYDARDRLKGEDSDGDSAIDDTVYAYDTAGNTLSVTTPGGIKLYIWDLRGRMTGYDANGDGDTLDAGEITYGYDEQGLRVFKHKVGEQPINLLLDRQNPTGYAQVLEERQNGTLIRSYLLGHDVIAQTGGSSVQHLLYDGGGHTRATAERCWLLTVGRC